MITIPTKVNNTTESEKHSYNFSVKDVQNDGILECIQQSHNKSMESLGKIMFRMQIHANDDSYQNTKVKMAVAAEQELKKYNTKVIQSSDPNVGRKVKVKSTGRPPFGSKPYPPLTSSGTPNQTFKAQPSSLPLSSMPRFSKFTAASGPSSLSKPASFFHNNSNFSDTLKKTIRENLVHYLAVKSMKLADLLSKLQDKLKEPVDKNAVIGLLNSISTSRDGIYHLSDSVWDEVQVEWAHYSKEERDSVQKRNPLLINLSDTHPVPSKSASSSLANPAGNNSNANSISPLSDSSVRSQSSPSSVGASPSQKNSPYSRSNVKRTEAVYLNANLKRFKSDNPRLPAQSNGKPYPSANSSALANLHSPLDKLNNNISDHESPESRNSFASNANCYKASIAPLHEAATLGGKKSDASTDRESYHSRVNPYQRISGNGSGSINSSPNSSPDSGISHIGNVPSSDSSINDPDEYLRFVAVLLLFPCNALTDHFVLQQVHQDSEQRSVVPVQKRLCHRIPRVSTPF